MRRFDSLMVAAAVLFLWAGSAATAKTLWQSDFLKKGIEQFNIYDVGPQINPDFVQSSGPSVWTVKNGTLDQSSNIYGTPDPGSGDDNPYTGTQAVVKDFSAQDGTFYMQFKTQDNDAIGIVFRYQNEKNFMRFVSIIDSGNAGPITRLEKWTDGNFETLDMTRDTVYQQNVQETMLVVCKGDQVEAYLGDLSAPLLKGTDSDPKPGSFGVHLYAMSGVGVSTLTALAPDSNLYLAKLSDANANPISGLWTSLSQNGKPVQGLYTNPSGQAMFIDVPAGDYDLSIAGLTLEPAAPQKATVKQGINSQSFTMNVKPTASIMDMTTAGGAKWLLKLPAAETDDYRDPAASDSGWIDSYEVPSSWDSIDSTDNLYGWLRIHVLVPAAYQGKDLALADWAFSDVEWTYWDGQFMGHDDDYTHIRTYVVPGSLVKADNVLAVRGLNISGNGGFQTSVMKVVAANPSVTITGKVADRSGNPAEGIQVTAFAQDTLWGPQSAYGVTNADGVYRISGLAAGDFAISRAARIDISPTIGETINKTGAAGETITADFTVTIMPSMDLTTAGGQKWLGLGPVDKPDPALAQPTGVDESAAQDVTVPSDIQGSIGPDLSFFWYRAHIKLSDSVKAFKGSDLIVTGFNVDDADVTYFNGKEIGRTGTFPTDPADPDNTGYSGNAGAVRTYTVPASLVNWDGDNVLAINGYNHPSNGGMTSSGPRLVVVPSAAPTPVVTIGDLNGDGKVNVQDATLSLRIAVGVLSPTDGQKAAGDVNNDGKLNVADTTLILRYAVGIIATFPK